MIPDTKTSGKFLPCIYGRETEQMYWVPLQEAPCDGAAILAHPPKKVHGGQFYTASQSSHGPGRTEVFPDSLPNEDSRPFLELKECPRQDIQALFSPGALHLAAGSPFRVCGFRICSFLF